jgi:hypothetical protein
MCLLSSRVFTSRRFRSLVLRNVILQNGGPAPALIARDGNSVVLDRVRWIPERNAPYVIEQVDSVKTDRDLDEP